MLTTPAVADTATTPIGDLQRGQATLIEGVVERITDEDEFILSDDTGQVPVYIGPNPMPVAAGASVRVDGQMDDDGPREFYATEIHLADGQVVELPRNY